MAELGGLKNRAADGESLPTQSIEIDTLDDQIATQQGWIDGIAPQKVCRLRNKLLGYDGHLTT
jgi:hypothetical protein